MNGQAPAPVYYPPYNPSSYPTYGAPGPATITNGYATHDQPNGLAEQQQYSHARDPTQDSGYYGPGPLPPPQNDNAAQYKPGHAHHHPQLMTTDADYGPYANADGTQKEKKRLSKKWRKRLYWIVPLVIIGIAIVILFEIYKDDFLRWAQPLEDWLRERKDWSWIVSHLVSAKSTETYSP